jgi:hypothetical protein
MAAENAAFASGSRKRGRPKSISKCQVEVYIVELAKLIGAFIQEASGITVGGETQTVCSVHTVSGEMLAAATRLSTV